MFSPEYQQIEICLLKSNLEEIENDLMVQHSALPALDAENELKYRETMAALRVVRSLNSEVERLKQDSVRLTAKRMQLKRQCEDITRELERARGNRSELEDLLKQEENNIEQEIRNYEDTLRDIADRFRKTPAFFNEDEIRTEMKALSRLNIELEIEEKQRQCDVIKLQQELDKLQPSVPQDIVSIAGKTKLGEKIKDLSVECDALLEKRNNLLYTSSQNRLSITRK